MKSQEESAIRMLRFQVEERRRQMSQIDAMIDEFNRMISDLDREIEAEHRRTGIEDEKNFAYSVFARAARQRRANLKASVDELQGQFESATAAFDRSASELEEKVRIAQPAETD